MRSPHRAMLRFTLSLVTIMGIVGALLFFIWSQGLQGAHASSARSTVPGPQSAQVDSAVPSFQGTHGTLTHARSLSGVSNAWSHPNATTNAPARFAHTHLLPLPKTHRDHTKFASSNSSKLPAVGGLPDDAFAAAAVREGQLLHNFAGLNSLDSATANGFLLEPPDQGLCVGTLAKTKVVGEIINDVVAFYSPSGTLLSNKLSLNTFFGEPAAETMTDPRCHFDTSTNTFFFSVLAIDPTNVISNHVDIAVLHQNLSEFVLPIDVTFASNTAGQCPCLGDQPKLGIDKNNVYISVDQYNTAGTAETGAALIAVSKSQLIAGTTPINEAVYLNLSLTGIPITGLQPALTTGNVGQEYLLNSFPYSDPAQDPIPLTNTLGLWSLSNTASVTTGGVPDLTATTVTSEIYGYPVPALTTNGLSLATYSNDDRLQQVQYINGQLWAALDSAVAVGGDPITRDGAAWFEVKPVVDVNGAINKGTITQQGYVASQGRYILYPAIQTTTEGTTGIAFSITSPTLNPSTGYVVRKSGSTTFGSVHLTRIGSGPDIGFTCTLGAPQQCRWGDYSWATLDPNGKDIWMAAEDTVAQVATATSGAQTNWGTQIWDVKGDY